MRYGALVSCNSCGDASTQVIGAVMSGELLRCEGCGAVTAVLPLRAPPYVVNAAGFNDPDVVAYRNDLSDAAGRCAGAVRVDAPVRCERCHSSTFRSRHPA